MSDIFGSENGLGAGIYREVMNTITANPAPVAATSVQYAGTTVAARLDGLRTLVDRGAVGDGLADDTEKVRAGVGSIKKRRIYKATSWDNTLGVDVSPDGIVIDAVTHRVYNPSQHRYMQMFGHEVLQHWFSLFARNSDTVAGGEGRIKKMRVSGDSVTAGYGNTVGIPSNVLTILAEQRGYKNVAVENGGQSGMATFHWLETFLAADLASGCDLLVLGWGDNDFGLGRTAEQLLADYRTGLTRIRAAKTPAQMSVILRTPTTMSDPTNNRTGARIEQIIDGFKQLARDFQCGFVDVYSMLQNGHDGAGVWMDALPGAVHPLDVMQEHICAAIADLALPNHGADWKNNGVYNYGSATKNRTAAAPPSNYFDGVTMVRSLPGDVNGGPYDGIFYTFKQADSATLQMCTPLFATTPGYGVSMRLGFNDNWGPFLGQRNDLVSNLAAGWTAQPQAKSPSRWFTLDGAVCLQGTVKVKPGFADGDIVLTLPAGWCPDGNIVCLVATSIGVARLSIAPDGVARIYGAVGSEYIALNGVQFKG